MNIQAHARHHGIVEISGIDLQFNNVRIDDETPSGAQLAHAAGFAPSDHVFVLQLREDGQLEDVRYVEAVSLADGRRFIVAKSDRSFRVAIDGNAVDWPSRFINAATLRRLAEIPDDKVIFLEKDDEADRLLAEDELIDLDEPGVERFRQAKDNRPKEQTVRVRHLGELETASFKTPETATLQSIWDRAYQELDIGRDSRDVFQADVDGHPVDLMGNLGLSLAEAQNRDLCKRKFEIAARTGGA